MRRVELLPPGQLLAAPSPRRPAEEQNLLAAQVTQAQLTTIEQWQRQVRRRVTHTNEARFRSCLFRHFQIRPILLYGLRADTNE